MEHQMNSAYKHLYQPSENYADQIMASQSIDCFLPLERANGIQIYIHKIIAHELCCYLVWEKPVENKHVDSIEHDEWDGWITRGWDIPHTNMAENLALNKRQNDFVYDIEINGLIVAKTTFKECIPEYMKLLQFYFGDITKCRID